MRNRDHNKNPRSGKVFLGMLLLVIGSLLLLSKVGLWVPGWLIWPMFLIVIGVFLGIRHNFRNPISYILILIGSILLFDRMLPDLDLHIFIWPSVLIAVGLYLILGRNRKGNCKGRMENFEWDKRQNADPVTDAETKEEPIRQGVRIENYSDQDFVDATSVFGGVKKNIVSKNFRGGDIVNFFGGAEINLTQADIQGRVVLEVTQIFGGTKIIVPPHWEVHPEMTAIFGGIEDKRPIQSDANSGKVLIIKGTSIFGGIDIRSF